LEIGGVLNREGTKIRRKKKEERRKRKKREVDADERG
jgi:hypothetical protein